MDRKSIIGAAVCFLLLILWFPLVNKMYPPQVRPPTDTNAPLTAVTAPPVATNGRALDTAVRTTTTAPTAPAFPPPSADEQTLVVADENARYTFTSQGGGLKFVELLHYPQEVSRRSRRVPLTNGLATLNQPAPAPVLAQLGGEPVRGDDVFTLRRTANGVRAEKELESGLRLIKEYTLGTNYLLRASVRMENPTATALVVPAQEWVMGTATPMSADDTGMRVGLMWFNGSKKQEILSGWFDNMTLGCFPGTPRPEYRAGNSNVVWASSHNQFFTLLAMPDTPAEEVVSRVIELPRASDDEPSRRARPPKGIVTSFAYPPLALAPGESVARDFNFFIGPKEYRTLARLGERFQNKADLVMSFGYAGFFAKALLLSMNWLHGAFNLSYGVCIVVITFIIKLLFWPLTAASTRSMKRMAALQPQMKELQAKYKDDPAKMNRKLMEFMKENKVNPLGGCLPMLLQMPVFIGFFFMIQSAIELRGARFLWVSDLSRPDTLFYIPGLDFPFNLLPLLMGATMLWQAHLTPPSPTMDPMQQKIMKYLPLMFMVFLYNFSAGLTLYWTVQNLLTIVQTKLTKSNEPVVAVAPPSNPALTPARKKKK